MRQRKAKNLKEKLAACSDFLINPERIVGGQESIEEAFPVAERQWGKMFVEIGCGKGQFILNKALENPQNNYLGIEGQETVILRAAEKAISARQEMGKPCNLKLMNCFVNHMPELFKENSLAGVYLNFSDPWPKARHAKRRLTYHGRLLDYAWAIEDGGFIEIKTDNDGLYEFTLEEINQVKCLEICHITRDLHSIDCKYDARHVTTEYEDKFKSNGKNINYVKAIVNKKES